MPPAGMPPMVKQFAGNPAGDEKAVKTFDESRQLPRSSSA